jgi:putative ABC transport system substrate-binding protein
MTTHVKSIGSSKRRALVLAIGTLPALAWRLDAHAQPKKPPLVIGWLNNGSRAALGHFLTAFHDGMAAHGWKRGSDYVVEERWAEGQIKRLDALTTDLVVSKPVIYVAAPAAAVIALAKIAPNVPIVQASGGGPVRAGLAKSLTRPAGMVTGLSNMAPSDVATKYLDLLLDVVPSLRRVGFLIDSSRARTGPTYKQNLDTIQRWIERYRIEAITVEVAHPDPAKLG